MAPFLFLHIVDTLDQNFHRALRKHLPENTVDYCLGLWKKFPFSLKIKRPRKTKLGDYRFEPQSKSHLITLNADLNPYAFLVTYLHEVAHLITVEKYGRRVSPHGKEWKSVFQYLLKPLTKPGVLPEDILIALSNYIAHTKAASCSDRHLTEALARYDKNPKIFLKDIESGTLFTFQERIFKKGVLRRTRFVCDELKGGKSYLISSHAEISPVPTVGR